MSKFDRLRNENDTASNNIEKEAKKITEISDNTSVEAKRAGEFAKNSDIIIEKINYDFERSTKLKGIDITLLFTAVAMQCVRQYVIGTITQRGSEKEMAKKTDDFFKKIGIDIKKEITERSHRLYNPSLQEIQNNHVPFDTTFGSKEMGLGIGGGFKHRAKTLGHDPLLGLIFGTGNIATSTITLNNFRTYHVLQGFTANSAARDKISMNASTLKMLDYTKNKLIHEGAEGKKKIGVSLMKEVIHLSSDVYSKKSIPLPGVSGISYDSAKTLADYGLDMGNVIKVSSQAEFAVLINSLIAMFHGLFYDEAVHGSRKLYSVKTRKILSYSNLIASASNVIAVALGVTAGVMTENKEIIKKSLNYLDLGGLIVTIYRLVTDGKFITEIKKEFLENEWYNAVLGEY